MKVLTVNRGPVSDDIRVLDAGLIKLLRLAKQRGFTSVEITPDWTGTFADQASRFLTSKGWQTDQSRRTSLRLDLTSSLEEMLRGFRKVARYEIRRAERFQLEPRFANTQTACNDWLKLYEEMAKAKHFASETSMHLHGVLRWLVSEPRYGGLLLADAGGKLAGGIVIVRCGTRCWYVFGATAKDAAFSVGHLLQWHAFQWAKSNGCTEYDFGGYTPGAKNGPAFFKSGFSQNIVTFPPMHRFVLSPMHLRFIELVEGVRRHLK